MKKIKHRVFFHEVGHFVASEINHSHFGLSTVEKIILTKHELGNSINYSGQTIFIVPEGEQKDKPLVNLPQKLANLIYGCYFQSLFLDTELKLCFDFSNPDANGKIDYNQTFAALTQFKTPVKQRVEFFPYIEQQYFNELKTPKADFNKIFQLNPEDYFIEINNYKTEVNLKKLRVDISGFLKIHQNTYLGFISEINRILEWK